MNKNKHIAILSTTAIGALVATALTSNIQAKVISYVVDDNGKNVKYNAEQLVEAYSLSLSGGESPMWDSYLKSVKNVVAFEDDIKGLVSYQSVENAYTESLSKGKDIKIDDITANAKDSDKANIKIEAQWKDGKITSVEQGLKVESVSAINDNSIQVTGLNKEVKEADLKDKKITIKAGDVSLTATYVATSLTEGKANFVLDAEKKLTDAVTYTVASENFNFAKDTFMAKVKAAYVKTITVTTKEVPAVKYVAHKDAEGVKPAVDESGVTKIYFTAKDQYGEDMAIPANNALEAKGTLNGVPMLTSEVIYDKITGKNYMEVKKTLVEGNKVILTLTNKINEKDVEVGTASYVVAKHEDSVATTISNMKATYQAEHGHQVADKFDNVLPADQVDLNVDVNDQFGNPMPVGTEVRWVVEEGKGLITKTDGNEIKEVSDAAIFSFKAVKAGKLKISAYNVANGEKQTFETVIGANKLTELTINSEQGLGAQLYNQNENIVKVVTPNIGANLTAGDIKFDIQAAKTTVDVTSADVQVTAKVRGENKENKDKNDVVISIKSTKTGKYTITPYVGESLEKATAKGASFDVTTTVDQTVASIDDIKFDDAELKSGVELKKDVTFKNKHGEVVVLDDNIAKVTVTPEKDAADAAKVTKEVKDGVSKNVLTLKLKDAKTYNVVINKDDIFKAYNLKFVGPKFTSINAGANVTGVVAGDAGAKAKYQEVKFLDQDGKAMDVKKEALKVSVTKPDGQDLGDANLAKLITLGKTYSVSDKGVVNFVAVANNTDNVAAYKISPAAELKQGTYTVKIANIDGKISSTFTVTVGAERVAKTVEVTTDSTNVALNGQTELKIIPKDQYGEFIANANIEVVGGDHFAKEGAITPIEEKGVTIGYKAVVKATSKGTNDVVVNVKDGVADDAKVIATNKVNMTVDSVAGLINSIEINKEGIQPAYSTEKAGTKVQLEAIAKDAKGQVVPVDSSKDLAWRVTAVDGKVTAVDGKVTAAKISDVINGDIKNTTGEFTLKAGFKGTIKIQVLTANMKTAEITLTCDNTESAAKTGTTNVVANVVDKVLDGDKDKKDIQVLLDGKNADGEENGAVVVKVVAKDQFGEDFTGTNVNKKNTTVMVGDSSIVDAKINDDHTITLTSKAVGNTEVNVIYNGDTVKLEVSVNKEAVDKAVAKAESDNLGKATQKAKEALNKAIITAKRAKDGIKVSDSADKVESGVDFVAQADKETYNTAITTAEGIKNKANGTKKEFEDALTDLNTATKTFNGKKHKGTKVEQDTDATLKSLTVGGTKVTLADAVGTSGAKLKFSDFTGDKVKAIAVEANSKKAQSVVVKVKGTVVKDSDLATKVLAKNDEITVEVTAESGETKTYKVILKNN